MRRSRSGLVLFFCTFMGSLMGVGLADGGHQSVGRPADQYRLDLDEPSDDWCGMGKLSYAPDDDQEPATVDDSAIAPVGAEGWIVLPWPGTWPIAVLYVDDEAACLISTAADAVAPTDAGRDSASANDWSSTADFVDWSQFSAASFGQLSCTFDPSDEVRELAASSLVMAEPASDEDLLLNASASGGWLAALLVWEHVNAETSPRECAWEGCQTYPDASMSGWLDESAAIADAQLWRGIGRAAQQMVSELAACRDGLIAAASQRIASMLNWPAAATTAEVAPAADDLRNWLNVSRTPGSFLAL